MAIWFPGQAKTLPEKRRKNEISINLQEYEQTNQKDWSILDSLLNYCYYLSNYDWDIT